MEYLKMVQEWFGRTGVYQQFLKDMPPPVNNIYFDILCVLIAACYLVFRVVDGVRITGYHRRVRRRQAEEQRGRREAERQLKERETEVRGREEKIYHFLDACEHYFWNRGGRNAGNTGGQTGGFFSRIGRKDFLLSDREGDMSFDPAVAVSDYDVQMQAMEESRRQEESFEEQRRKERERVDDSMSILEEQMRVEPETSVGGDADAGVDLRFEKRRARALKAEQREKERAGRAAERERKKAVKRGVGGEN